MPDPQGQLEELEDSGVQRVYRTQEEAVGSGDASAQTFNTQVNLTDQSLHVHQAMLLPDADAAERLQLLYPAFMADVMEGRRREQRARLLRERRQQDLDAEMVKLRMEQAHQSDMRERELSNQRFGSAVAMMGLIGFLFAVVGVVALLRGNYWPAGGMGLGMAYCFSQVVKALKASKD